MIASGDEPAVGARIDYTIKIKNNSNQIVTNIDVWDSLPAELTFVSSDFSVTPQFDPVANYLRWDLGDYELGYNEEITIRFSVIINDSVDLDKLPITNRAEADYNDDYYNDTAGTGKNHISSDDSFYPTGRPVVFPNPYNPRKDGNIRFENIVPNSQIEIYTISGENVITINTNIHKAFWDGKNRYGREVSSGIYFFVIKNMASGQVLKGKLFIVKNQ